MYAALASCALSGVSSSRYRVNFWCESSGEKQFRLILSCSRTHETDEPSQTSLDLASSGLLGGGEKASINWHLNKKPGPHSLGRGLSGKSGVTLSQGDQNQPEICVYATRVM